MSKSRIYTRSFAVGRHEGKVAQRVDSAPLPQAEGCLLYGERDICSLAGLVAEAGLRVLAQYRTTWQQEDGLAAAETSGARTSAVISCVLQR